MRRPGRGRRARVRGAGERRGRAARPRHGGDATTGRRSRRSSPAARARVILRPPRVWRQRRARALRAARRSTSRRRTPRRWSRPRRRRAPIVVGADFGALVALDLLRRHGALARAAVLVDPPPLMLVPDATRGAGRASGSRSRRRCATAGRPRRSSSTRVAGRRRRARPARAGAPGAFFADYGGLATLPINAPRASRGGGEVVVLDGAAAPRARRAASDALAALLPRARAAPATSRPRCASCRPGLRRSAASTAASACSTRRREQRHGPASGSTSSSISVQPRITPCAPRRQAGDDLLVRLRDPRARSADELGVDDLVHELAVPGRRHGPRSRARRAVAQEVRLHRVARARAARRARAGAATARGRSCRRCAAAGSRSPPAICGATRCIVFVQSTSSSAPAASTFAREHAELARPRSPSRRPPATPGPASKSTDHITHGAECAPPSRRRVTR